MALALHACGNATDFALLAAQRAHAAFIVSPCCVGKLKFSANVSAAVLQDKAARGRSAASFAANLRVFADRAAAAALSTEEQPAADGDRDGADVPLLQHPRSEWMRSGLLAAQAGEGFEALARAADISHVEGHSYPASAQLAKVSIIKAVHSECLSALSCTSARCPASTVSACGGFGYKEHFRCRHGTSVGTPVT